MAKKMAFLHICEYKGTVRPFKAIPGPKSYPVVGTLLSYIPCLGKYRFDKLHQNGLSKLLEYGPVIREEIVPGVNIVWINTPEDIQELFRKEGRYPERRSHLAIEHYRNNRKDVYNTGGLLPTNGPDWWKLRSVFQKGLSSPQNVRLYLPVVNQVVDEFMELIEERNDKTDFLPDISRVFLEMLGLVAFDVRLNSLSAEELKPRSRSSRLMDAALTTNSLILKTDNSAGLWRKWDTPLYKKLKQAHFYMEEVAVDLIEQKKAEIVRESKPEKEQSLLEIYLKSTEIDIKDVIGMSVDMLLAGIDTTTYTTCFWLYHLGRNRDKQECIYREAADLLPDPNSPVTSEVLAQSSYAKAALKESFRLNPISVGVGRILTNDAVFSGYEVPKGNVVVTQNQVVSSSEKYFAQPEEYIPERWMRNHPRYETVSPYLVLPFGHGPRTCIARRLAEQNMQTLVIKLCRNYEISWLGKNLDFKSLLINKPDGPVLLSFKKRTKMS